MSICIPAVATKVAFPPLPLPNTANLIGGQHDFFVAIRQSCIGGINLAEENSQNRLPTGKNAAKLARMIRFNFFGIPVEIQPWFWITMALLGSGGRNGENQALSIALFVIAGAISIFIHELGHAYAGKFFKARPFIVLQAFGGFAAFPGSAFTRVQSFLVTAAGPAIQLALGAAAVAVLLFAPLPTDNIKGFVSDLRIVSFFWALLNMIPVYPLDGGQMMAAVLGPQRRRLMLKISIGTAVLVSLAFLLLKLGLMFPIFMLLYAYQNFQELTGSSD